MRFCSLSSGSEGNALLVEAQASGAATVRFLVDCGLGLREAEARLAQRGLSPAAIDFIYVTHEHGDHIGGVAKLARAHDIPVLATHGTVTAAGLDFWSGVSVACVSSHRSLEVEGISINPIPVPHDAREPVALVLEDAQHRMAIVTDLGHQTPHLTAALEGLDAIFLEFNYDETLLREGNYPASLKSRIDGPYGHLSNRASAEVLSAVCSPRLQHVIAAHLSRQNNSPELVIESVTGLDLLQAHFRCASQHEGLDWVALC